MRFGAEGAAQNYPAGSKKATVAAGCFWGVEHMYRRAFANQGLIDAKVGYIGGDTKNPSYRSVCSGRTGREYQLGGEQRYGASWLTTAPPQTPKPSK